MHEVSLVADLVDEVVRRAQGRPVAVVRVRHANTLPDDVLEQAFAMLTADDGVLAGATLDREELLVTITCSGCGRVTPAEHDHSLGNLVICPECGALTDNGQGSELELLGVDYRGRAVA